MKYDSRKVKQFSRGAIAATVLTGSLICSANALANPTPVGPNANGTVKLNQNKTDVTVYAPAFIPGTSKRAPTRVTVDAFGNNFANVALTPIATTTYVDAVKQTNTDYTGSEIPRGTRKVYVVGSPTAPLTIVPLSSISTTMMAPSAPGSTIMVPSEGIDFTINGYDNPAKRVPRAGDITSIRVTRPLRRIQKPVAISSTPFEFFTENLDNLGVEYNLTNSESQIADDNNIRKLTAPGTAFATTLDQTLGWRGPRNALGLRLSGNYNNSNVSRLQLNGSSIGNIKGSGLEGAVQLLYGRNLGATSWKDSVETALGVWLKRSNNRMKYDILNINSDENLLGGIATIRLNGSVYNVPFRITAEGIVASGKTTSNTQIPSLSLKLPENSSNVNYNGERLNLEVFPWKLLSLYGGLGLENESRTDKANGINERINGISGNVGARLTIPYGALRVGYETTAENDRIGSVNYPMNDSSVTLGLEVYTQPIAKGIGRLFKK